MTLTIELDPKLKQALARRSADLGVSRSVVVKWALAEYLANELVSAYEAGKDLFGRHGSGEGNLSARRREYHAEIVEEKRRLRR
jgi:hypothetical protein